MKLVLVICFLFSIFIIAIFLYSYYRLYTQTHLHVRPYQKEFPADLEKPQTFFVSNENDQKIAYWYYPVENAKAVVILVHGYRNSGGKSLMLDHAAYLKRAGYSTVLVDLRAHAESDGKRIYFGVKEWQDVAAVYEDVKQKPENGNLKIGYFGISMGAVTAINTQAQTGKGDFVIAAVPFKSLNSLFDFQVKKEGFPSFPIAHFLRLAAIQQIGSDYNTVSPEQLINKINVAILLISAKQDDVLHSQDAVDLYYMANEPKELWEVESKHDIYDEKAEEVEQKILEFLNNI